MVYRHRAQDFDEWEATDATFRLRLVQFDEIAASTDDTPDVDLLTGARIPPVRSVSCGYARFSLSPAVDLRGEGVSAGQPPYRGC